MKRRRKSKPCSTQPLNSDANSQTSGLSITDLPSTILVEIFLELPTESIVMCKSVCKAWRGIISDREFARTHFAQGKECTLIRDIARKRISRSCFLFEDKEFRSGFCRCAVVKKKCKLCGVIPTVKVGLKIPLRNTQDMLSRLGDVNIDDAMFCLANADKSKQRIILSSSHDHSYDMVNSCNGLVCLSKSRLCHDLNNPMVICNPVTGEFMYLPKSVGEDNSCVQLCGFGFSPKHNKYKAIRVVYFLGSDSLAVIHTMGTKSWRKLDSWAFDEGCLESPAYLDGALYWICRKIDEVDSMLLSFDFNEERFQAHSMPYEANYNSALRVQGGRLHMSDTSVDGQVHVWVMNENGNPKSWTKLFSIDSQIRPFGGPLVCSVNNEAVVILSTFHGMFLYIDVSKRPNIIQLKFPGIRSNFEAVTYTPSFIPLKDIVGLTNVEVLSINSGCGKLKLVEETRPLKFRA